MRQERQLTERARVGLHDHTAPPSIPTPVAPGRMKVSTVASPPQGLIRMLVSLISWICSAMVSSGCLPNDTICTRAVG
jgi:hypothetical protein